VDVLVQNEAQRELGFTLLEIIVVTAIVAILATLVVPALKNNSTRELNADVERFLSLLNQAREEAVLSSRPWRVEIDTDADTYRFAQSDGGEFVPVKLSLFAGEFANSSVDISELEVNGETVTGLAQCVLFPSGEQDSMRATFSAFDEFQRVSLPPVGDARLEER